MSRGNSEDNPFLPKDGSKPYSAKINLIANIQLAGAFAICGAVAFLYSHSEPNWQRDPTVLTILGVLAVTGIIVHLILRSVLATAYERQSQQTGAIRDSSLSPVADNDPEKIKIGRKKQQLAISATLILLACGMLVGTGTMLSSPFHFYECFIAATLLGLPVGCGVIRLFMIQNPVWPFPASAQQEANNPFLKSGALYLQRAIFLVVLAVLFSSLSIALNQWLDQSQPRQETFRVIGQHVRTHKRTTSHYLEIASTLPSPVPFLDFGNVEGVHVTQSEYIAAISGQTQITVNIYPGFFGIPWYREAHVFPSPVTTTPRAAVNHPAAPLPRH